MVIRKAAISILATALAWGGTDPAWGGVPRPPGLAQSREPMELDGRQLVVTPAEEMALAELGAAIRDRRRALQETRLARARKAARSADALYALGIYELAMARQWKDEALRSAALDRLIASPATPPAKLAGFLASRGAIAFEARDLETARTLWARVVEMKPDDPDALNNLAQAGLADPAGSVALLGRAIAARERQGAKAPEGLYRQRLILAAQGGLRAEGAAAARALLAAYPSKKNWREALVMYRQLAAPQDGLEIDLLRLMRTTGSLERADEYQRLAQLLSHAGRAAEARAVLAEGESRGLLAASASPTREIIAEADRALPRERERLEAARRKGWAGAGTEQMLAAADSLFGAGRHAEAADLYRSALASAGSDGGEIQVRLGMTLLLAGRRSEAEAAFRAASARRTGPASGYGDLAALWSLWLARPEA